MVDVATLSSSERIDGLLLRFFPLDSNGTVVVGDGTTGAEVVGNGDDTPAAANDDEDSGIVGGAAFDDPKASKNNNTREHCTNTIPARA